MRAVCVCVSVCWVSLQAFSSSGEKVNQFFLISTVFFTFYDETLSFTLRASVGFSGVCYGNDRMSNLMFAVQQFRIGAIF
uniref:Putative secreted protein n=1 Tax=Anopheles marajoara TaxID=58244 RepID=A0A2M4CBU1_9DIPT